MARPWSTPCMNSRSLSCAKASTLLRPGGGLHAGAFGSNGANTVGVGDAGRAAIPPLRERLDQMMRDRHREGRLQPSGCVAGEHQPHLLALEPAAVLQLRRVALDLGRQRLGVAADHQRGGERPGLARMIGDAADRDAGLLLHLAPHRLLDRLARLQEAGERRIHAGREARLPAEQAALAVDRQHDHHRIDARKNLDRRRRRRCGCTPPPLQRERPAAAPAEAVRGVPVEIGARLRERREVGRRRARPGSRASGGRSP